MNTTLLELDGTAEEIQHRLAEYPGQQLHVMIRPLTELQGLAINGDRKLTITEELMMMGKDIPPEELAKIPVDLADQHDHYIYG